MVHVYYYIYIFFDTTASHAIWVAHYTRELEYILYLYFIIRFCRPIRKEEEIENLLPNTNLQFPFVGITHRPEYQIFVANTDGV